MSGFCVAPLHLGDGKWLAAARSNGLNLYYSDDDAKTWTHRQRVTDAQQHPGDLHRLQDGRLLLTYGYRTSPGLELLHGRTAPDEQAKTERSYVKTAQGERPEPIVAIDNVCAWPNLTVLRDGTIIATIFNQPSHGLVAGDVDCWASEDGGATWTKRGTPAAGHDRYHMGVVVWDPSASLSCER